jgi:hypothetical protein
VTTALGIASQACALVRLPLELTSLASCGCSALEQSFIRPPSCTFGFPVLAITFGALGLARIKSARGRGRRPALPGLWPGGSEVCPFTLATALMLTHGDRLA